MMPSYITGVIIAGMFINKKLLKVQIIFSVVFHVLFSLQILFYLVPIKSDDTWVGWEELANETATLKETYTEAFVFSNDNYKTSACLNFFMKDKVYAQNIIGLPSLHFDYLGDDLNILKGKNALFIDSDKRFKDSNKLGEINPLLTSHFKNVIELAPIIIKVNGKESRKFWIFYCTDYQPKK
jgi:hypothetical protein